MAFSEKIKLYFDIDTIGASKNIKGLRSDVADAEGAFGKAKAGAAGLGGMLKDNIGTAAVAAGAALIGFGVKAIGAFTDSAKAAVNLGAATGLSTEQASRWVAVADDMEVGADQLTSGLGKIAKTLDSGKWEEYGIATRDAGGNARDTNDILLDSFDMLGKITNETERAKVGNELFGKGYANLAPLIGKTRGEYDKLLGSVSDGQVITEKETKTAEKMRLAQDALADAFGDVMLSVGQLASEAAPALTVVAKGITAVADAIDLLGGTGMTDAIKEFAALSVEADKFGITQHEIGLVLRENNGDFVGATAALAELVKTTKEKTIEDIIARDAAKGLSKEERDSADAADKAAKATRGLSKDKRDDTAATIDAANATRELTAEYNALLAPLSNREAWLSLLDSLDEYAWKMNSGTLSTREAEQATIDIRQELIGYLGKLEEVPAKKQTEILSLIDQGQYDLVREMLDQLAAPRTVRFTPTGDAIGSIGPGNIKGATGGIVTRPTMALIGEAGPEAVIPLNRTPGSSPLGNLGGGGGMTVNITTGADPRQVIEVIKRYQRQGGQL